MAKQGTRRVRAPRKPKVSFHPDVPEVDFNDYIDRPELLPSVGDDVSITRYQKTANGYVEMARFQGEVAKVNEDDFLIDRHGKAWSPFNKYMKGILSLDVKFTVQIIKKKGSPRSRPITASRNYSKKHRLSISPYENGQFLPFFNP